MTGIKKIMVLFFLISATSACSVFSPVAVTPQNYFLLDKVPHVASTRSHHATLLVAQPATFIFYDTTQMAYTMHPLQAAYFSKNEWGARPAVMLQDLLIRTLQRTHSYRAVLPAGYPGKARFVLYTNIHMLRQNYILQPPRAEVVVHAWVVRVSDGHVIATKTLRASRAFMEISPRAGAAAMNLAVADVLGKIAIFCQRNT